MIRRRTNPLAHSAPLPADMSIEFPTTNQINAELVRAAAELMWALHRQRAAWAQVEQLKAEYGERNQPYIDNERPWKLALGDVSWWRGEVSSRANAVIALTKLAELLQ